VPHTIVGLRQGNVPQHSKSLYYSLSISKTNPLDELPRIRLETEIPAEEWHPVILKDEV
jgi:hypothetical protein